MATKSCGAPKVGGNGGKVGDERPKSSSLTKAKAGADGKGFAAVGKCETSVGVSGKGGLAGGIPFNPFAIPNPNDLSEQDFAMLKERALKEYMTWKAGQKR